MRINLKIVALLFALIGLGFGLAADNYFNNTFGMPNSWLEFFCDLVTLIFWLSAIGAWKAGKFIDFLGLKIIQFSKDFINMKAETNATKDEVTALRKEVMDYMQNNKLTKTPQ
jgi:hypothetical protein